MVWDKFISRNDQIFLVLCGHEHAQAFRADDNASGHKVYQVLADYQSRHQTADDAGYKRFHPEEGIGDGWMRLMSFDMSTPTPRVHVHTYSTVYKKESIAAPVRSIPPAALVLTAPLSVVVPVPATCVIVSAVIAAAVTSAALTILRSSRD